MTVPFWPTHSASPHLTVADLILQWSGNDTPSSPPSADWLRRSHETRARYLLRLRAIAERWGHRLLSDFNDHKGDLAVQDWRRELQATRRKADETVQVLNALFKFARIQGLMGHNPAAPIDQLGCKNTYGHVFWTDAELVRFRSVALDKGLGAVADFIELMALTGLGGQEAIELQFDDVAEYIVYRPMIDKERERRGLPAYPLLLEAKDFIDSLRRRPRHTNTDTVLVDANGARWGRAWVLGLAKTIRDQAEIMHVDHTSGEPRATPKQVKDLAKTWAIKAIRSGATDEDIVTLRRWRPSVVANLRTYAQLHPQPDLEAMSFPALV